MSVLPAFQGRSGDSHRGGPFPPASTAPAPGPGHGRRRRRRRAIGAAVTLAVLGTGAAVAVTWVASTPKGPGTTVSTPAAKGVVRRTDMVESDRVTGTIGYGAVTQLIGHKMGTLTWLPAPGTVIDRGGRLFAVNASPVPLLLGDSPMYRELARGVPDGEDVALLERNLISLGYTGFGSADGHFDAATARVLRRWQKANKLAETGRLAVGDVIVMPGAVRVESVAGQLGESAMSTVLKVTGTRRLVTAEIDESKRSIVPVGAPVTIELADRRTAKGTVRSADPKPDDTDKLTLTVSFDDDALAQAVEVGSTAVQIERGRRAGVLAVPVTALLALREGGYAVEVVRGGDTVLVAVTIGMFSNGLVEVGGEGVAEGDQVVMAP
jgi:peptidoglycan hydrolase-like protein with peptidoglycan-binding domain